MVGAEGLEPTAKVNKDGTPGQIRTDNIFRYEQSPLTIKVPVHYSRQFSYWTCLGHRR